MPNQSAPHPSSPTFPATEDLGLKIASVKKVWESHTITPVYEHRFVSVVVKWVCSDPGSLPCGGGVWKRRLLIENHWCAHRGRRGRRTYHCMCDHSCQITDKAGINIPNCVIVVLFLFCKEVIPLWASAGCTPACAHCRFRQHVFYAYNSIYIRAYTLCSNKLRKSVYLSVCLEYKHCHKLNL